MKSLDLGDTALLTATVAVVVSTIAVSCSTIEEPSEGDEPIVCEFCEVGTQALKCHIKTKRVDTDTHWAFIGESSNVCLDPDADEEEQETACVDSCEQWIEDQSPPVEVYCDFYDEEEPFFWIGCVPPEEETEGSENHTCPSWYSPTTKVSNYLGTSGSATVTIDRDFVLDIRSDMFSLYVCDTTRYVESLNDWTFDDVVSGDLFYQLGVRNGDQNATVQGFNPQNMQTTTSAYLLDSLEDMHSAYEPLLDVDGVKLTIERSGAPGGVFVIWITID